MIEIKYYYRNKFGDWIEAWTYFNSVDKAVRFLYKCKGDPKMYYSGELACDDPYDLQEINRRFR